MNYFNDNNNDFFSEDILRTFGISSDYFFKLDVAKQVMLVDKYWSIKRNISNNSQDSKTFKKKVLTLFNRK